MRDDIGSNGKGLRQKKLWIRYCSPARTRWARRPTRRGRRGRAERLQARGIPQGEGKEREKLLGMNLLSSFNYNFDYSEHEGNDNDNDDVDDLASGGERWERCKE